MTLEIYTDGCCLNNQSNENRGGWAFIAVQEPLKPQMVSGAAINTTNQRMELTACIEAMKFGAMTGEKDIHIITDSAYVVNCIKDSWYLKWRSNGWLNSKREPVKNQDLWEIFITFLEFQYFKFTHVKGHSGHEWNEKVDQLAKNAAKEAGNE